MFERMRRDIRTVLERDPAARSSLEVLLCYPGGHAIWHHRLAHWLWRRGRGGVMGEPAESGENVPLPRGVPLGGTSLKREKRHPTLGDNVVVGAGAKILGAFTTGAGSRIGAGSVVVREVPENSVVVGVPGRVTYRNGQRVKGQIDLDQEDLPAPLARTVENLLDRTHAPQGGGGG